MGQKSCFIRFTSYLIVGLLHTLLLGLWEVFCNTMGPNHLASESLFSHFPSASWWKWEKQHRKLKCIYSWCGSAEMTGIKTSRQEAQNESPQLLHPHYALVWISPPRSQMTYICTSVLAVKASVCSRRWQWLTGEAVDEKSTALKWSQG